MCPFDRKGPETASQAQDVRKTRSHGEGLAVQRAMDRSPRVQAMLQMKRRLDESPRVVAQARRAGAVVQRATPEELQARVADFNFIKGGIEQLRRAILEPPEEAPVREEVDDSLSMISEAATVREGFNEEQLESWLQDLYALARDIAADPDHEIFLSAYGGIYDYADKLIDRLRNIPGSERWTDTYLVPILDMMRRATAAVGYDNPEALEKYRQSQPEKFVLSLRETDPDGAGLNMVIAQAAYMSGDMFGVAAALRLDPTLGVVIFYDHLRNRQREIETKLLDFYRTQGGLDHPRVALIPVTDSQLAYKKAITGDFSNRRLFPHGKPRILSGVEQASTIGNATRIVAHAYATNPKLARAAVEEEWLPAGGKEGTATGGSTRSIAQWVHDKGFRKSRSYAFIWFRRSGARGGAHSELDTSEAATAQIMKVARGTAADQLVVIGDSGHSLSGLADIDLTEFWNEPDSPFQGTGRKMQLALFSYLVNNGFNIMNLGMRSGALEGPALLGVKTVFLEERYNLQEGRMDQWQDVVPGFKRIELEHVPTKAGKAELRKLIAMTIHSQKADYEYALHDLQQILTAKNVKAHGKPLDLGSLIREHAPRGIDVKRGIYEPDSVNNVLLAILRAIEKATGSRIRDLLGDRWPAFKSDLLAAIRAFQEWGKGLVKEALDTSYKGPEEGLNETDQNKLWAAIAVDVGGWQTTGSSSRSSKKRGEKKRGHF